MVCQGWNWCMVLCLWTRYWPWVAGAGTALGLLWLWWGRAMTLGQWLRNRYDRKVLSLMEEASRKARLEHPHMNIALLPFKISEIAADLNRTEGKVYKSLRRLEAQGKVHEVKMGEWSLGNQTQRGLNTKMWKAGRRF